MPIYLQKLQYYLELITFWQTKFNLVSKNSIASIWERHILDSLQLMKFIHLTPIYNLEFSSDNLITESPTISIANLNKGTLAKELITKSSNLLSSQSIDGVTANYNKVFTKKNVNTNNSSTSYPLPDEKIIFDLGSGAGFPSVVLAIMDSKNTYYAIESNSKKCVFLQYVKRELQLDNFIVINMRIEDFILQKQPVNLPFINQDYQAKLKADSTIKQNLKAHIVVARALTSLTTLLKYTEELLLPKGYGIFPKGISWQQELNDLSVQQQKLFTINSYNNLFSQGGKIIICQSKQ